MLDIKFIKENKDIIKEDQFYAGFDFRIPGTHLPEHPRGGCGLVDLRVTDPRPDAKAVDPVGFFIMPVIA